MLIKIFLLLAILISSIAIVIASDGMAKFVYVKGGVEVYSKDSQTKFIPKKGDSINFSNAIKTSNSGIAIIRLEDNSVLKIDPNSIVEIESLINTQKKSSGQSSFILKAGGIMAQIVKRKRWVPDEKDPPLEIKYKSVALGVRGTKFYVGVDQETEHLWSNVKEGRVRVVDYDNDDYQDIKFGESLFIEKGKTISSPTKYAWPLRLNWSMESRSNVRLQSNFFALKTRRKKEYKENRSRLLNRKKRSFKKMAPGRFKRLKTRRMSADKGFFKLRERIKPVKKFK